MPELDGSEKRDLAFQRRRERRRGRTGEKGIHSTGHGDEFLEKKEKRRREDDHLEKPGSAPVVGLLSGFRR
ncbi:hypothetical protein V6N13_000261 [Hibiscus sabdariffa]|uniref:Uncharacterized protein n=1 Tax=Hibiscus sabdariffa TaxID=183260 RepID=A0ABR2G4P9_9ROSI